MALAGCQTIEAVNLKHPTTGETVKCGPYSYAGAISQANYMNYQRGCIEDYQRQGFQRIP
jgi:hypothetical protein